MSGSMARWLVSQDYIPSRRAAPTNIPRKFALYSVVIYPLLDHLREISTITLSFITNEDA